MHRSKSHAGVPAEIKSDILPFHDSRKPPLHSKIVMERCQNLTSYEWNSSTKQRGFFPRENKRLQIDLIWEPLVSISKHTLSLSTCMFSCLELLPLQPCQPRRHIKTFFQPQSVLLFLLLLLIKSALLLPLSFFSSWASPSNNSSSNSPSKSHSSCVPPANFSSCVPPTNFTKIPEPNLCLYDIFLHTLSRNMKSLLITTVSQISYSSIKDPQVLQSIALFFRAF